MRHISVFPLAIVLTGLACERGEQPATEQETAPAAAVPRVSIVEPENGDTVGASVRVVLAAEGVEVAAADGQRVGGRGHHHLFIDTDPTPAGQPIPAGVAGIVHIGTGESEYTIAELAPGAHRIIAVLAYGDHVPMETVARDTVQVFVQ